MAVQASPATGTRPAARSASPLQPRQRPRSWTGLWYVLPFLAVYAGFLLWPTFIGLWYSFTNRSLAGGGSDWLGLANWQEMLDDAAVWDSLRNTVVFTLFSTPPLVALALVMALLTHRAKRLGWFLRFAFFAPYVLPVAVVALIWVWLYQPGFGLVNDTLTRLGFAEVGWLSDESVAMWSVVITTVWWTVGFNFLLYLAALQSIPEQVYEAASIDGATGWQRLWRITLPLLKRTTALIVVLQLVASLKIFDQVYLMTVGGPNFATRPVIQYVYETGFTGFRIGYASAISYMFFALILVISIAQFKIFAGKEDK